jgi:polyisoprenoid-binding protein YceI
LALLLSACAAPAVAPTAEEAPQQPAATQPPTAEPTQASEPTPTSAPLPLDGPVTFKLVPGESQVSYEVGETFLNQNNRFNLAVGVTTELSGDIQVDLSNPQNSVVGPISVDISKFTSDSNRRDGVIRDRFLESAAYPIATFTPTAINGLPASYTPGQELTFQVTGDLKVRTATQPVTFDVTAKIEGEQLTGSATTTILMSAFEVGPITIANILFTEDEARLTFNFVARP